MVERVREPASDKGSCEIDGAVDKTNNPFVPLPVGLALSSSDAEFGREREVGTVRTSLVPTLGGGTEGTDNNWVCKCSVR